MWSSYKLSIDKDHGEMIASFYCSKNYLTSPTMLYLYTVNKSISATSEMELLSPYFLTLTEFKNV